MNWGRRSRWAEGLSATGSPRISKRKGRSSLNREGETTIKLILKEKEHKSANRFRREGKAARGEGKKKEWLGGRGRG